MKWLLLIYAPLLLLFLGWCSSVRGAPPMGSGFNYQGRLLDNGVKANGGYDIRFTLYDAPTNGGALAGPLPLPAVAVSDGIFAVSLDFGSSVFNGESRWLELAVRTNGASAYVTLWPRQALPPVPYAQYSATAAIAANANNAAMADTAAGVVDGAIRASGIASGNVVKSLNSLKDNVMLAVGTNMSLTTTGQILLIDAPLPSDVAMKTDLANLSSGTNMLLTGAPTYKPDVISVLDYGPPGYRNPPTGMIQHQLNAFGRPKYAVRRSAYYVSNGTTVAIPPTGLWCSQPIAYCFATDAREFVIGFASDLVITVDGVPSDTFRTSGNGNPYRVVTFPDSRWREIELMGASANFSGVYLWPTNGFAVSSAVKPIRLIIAGDSISEDPPAAGTLGQGWGTRLQQIFLNLDVWCSASGGTGYAWSNTAARPSLIQRIGDITNNSPDAVLFLDGTNDGADKYGGDNAASSNATYQAALACYQSVQAACPRTQIIVGNMYSMLSPLDPQTQWVHDAIAKAINDAGVTNVIDMISDPWFFGTGNVLTPKEDGNNDVYQSGDGPHPSPQGHVYLAKRMAARLGEILPGLIPNPRQRQWNVLPLTIPTNPPAIIAVAVSPGETTATITWATDQGTTNNTMDYGLTTDYGSSTTEAAPSGSAHAVVLSGLPRNTTYYCRIRSTGALNGLSATNVPSSFTTLSSNPLGTLTNGLVEWWKLDEAVGDNPKVGSINGITMAKFPGYPSQHFSITNGIHGNALVIPTTNEYNEGWGFIVTNSSLDLQGHDFTIAFWANTYSVNPNNGYGILTKGDVDSSASLSIAVAYYGDGRLNLQSRWVLADSVFGDINWNRWYLYIIRGTASSNQWSVSGGPSDDASAFIIGIPDSQYHSPLADANLPLVLGGYYHATPNSLNNSACFAIDDLAIWKRAISDEECTNLFNGGFGTTVP